MEQIVRPFQSIDPTATIRVPVVRDNTPVAPAHLCWGAVGTLPTAVKQTQPFNGVNFRVKECDSHHSEVDNRAVEHVRVEQPGKPENYVIVERIRKISFKHNDVKTYNDTIQQGMDIAGQLDVFVNEFVKSGFCDLSPGGRGCDIKDDCKQIYRLKR